MYGGYGSSYGSLGGYGGMGSYGGGYGGSSYMGTYNSFNRLGQVQNNLDPNNPQQEPINQRKIIVEEFFKMMGGLRSMVEIGFSIVALGNFGSKSLKLVKKIIAFLSQTSHKLLEKISKTGALTDKMSSIYDKAMMISPNSKNGNTPINKLLMAMRLLAGLVIIIGVVLKGKLKDEIKKENEEMLEKFNEVKLEEEKLEIIERMEAMEDMEHHHQKEAYF